jgi:hypothetical protein
LKESVNGTRQLLLCSEIPIKPLTYENYHNILCHNVRRCSARNPSGNRLGISGIQPYLKKYGYTKLQLAQKLGKRPSEITKWLCGQHNFKLRKIAQLSAFFGEAVVQPYSLTHALYQKRLMVGAVFPIQKPLFYLSS